MSNNLGINMMQPDQAVADFNDEEYIKNLNFLASMYNNTLNNVPVIGANGSISTNGTASYITEYFNNLQYVYGTQLPSSYAFFTKDSNGNDTQIPMMRGLDVYKIFNYLHGQLSDMIDPLPKTTVASARSVDAVSARKNAMDYVYFQIKNKVFLNLIQQESGFGFKAIDRDFKTQDEVDKYFENFQEGMEIAYDNMAKDVLFNNDYRVLLPKVGDYVAIGNLGCICVEYVNGRPKWYVVPPEQAIVDYSKGLDIHLYDDFAGRVYTKTVEDVFTTWDFSEDEQKQIKAIAQNINSEFANYYAYMSNGISWFVNNNNIPKITIIEGQWRSLEKDSEGKWKEVLREGSLIGGKYLRGQKISEGQVWAKGDKSRKRLKYITLTPSLMMGTSLSIVSIIKRFQDLKDAFMTKMIHMASSAIGKSAIIRASKLPVGLSTPDVISQLKQANILVIEGDDTDEVDPNKKLAEVLDLTLDPNINLILQLVQYLDGVMSDVLNIPNSVRGQMGEYQSAKVVNNVQQQSTKGLAYYFKNYMLWVQYVVEYSADLYKFMAPDDELGREHLALCVGDAMTEIFSMDEIKRMQFSDFNLDLDSTNYINEQAKVELTQFAMQIATSGAPRKLLKDYLKLIKTDTITEMSNYLEAEIYKDDQREKQAQEAQLAAAQQNTAINADAQKQIATEQVQGSLDKAAMDNETKMMIAARNNKGGGV